MIIYIFLLGVSVVVALGCAYLINECIKENRDPETTLYEKRMNETLMANCAVAIVVAVIYMISFAIGVML